MTFTNSWNQAFPPDTQAANQLGLDLRQFKLDFQQRRAAMSGLYAQRPAFAQDTQPASWNGVLYFASDTQQILRFQNPSFVDVTANFHPARLPSFFKAQSVVTYTNPSGVSEPYSIAIPAGTMTATSRVRLSAFAEANLTGGEGSIAFVIAGPGVATDICVFTLYSVGGPYMIWMVSMGGNVGRLDTQFWMTTAIINHVPGTTGTPGAVQTTVNTAPGFSFQLQVVMPPGTISFYGMLVEVM